MTVTFNGLSRAAGVAGFAGASDLIKIQAALDSGASEVYLARDTVYSCSGILTIPSGVKLVGTNSTLADCRVTATGTAGSEKNLTIAVAVGDTTLPFNTTGFSAGDWVYVYGCTNINTSDAGNDQLAPFEADDYNYFAEFKRLKTIDSGSQATVEGTMMFPYAITAGANSGSRTCSTVRKVTFSEGGGLSGIKFTGEYTGTGQGISYVTATWTKGFQIDRCYFDIGTAVKHCFESITSHKDQFTRNRVRRGAYDATMAALASRSLYNSAIFKGATNPVATDNEIDGGYQCLDATYVLALAPSIDPIFERNTFRNSRDGATTHQGCIGGSLSNNVCYSENGVRIRTRNARAVNNVCVGKNRATGAGIYFAGGFVEGSLASANSVKSYLYGIQIEGSDTNGDPPNPLSVLINGNTISDVATGIIVQRNEASAKHLGVNIVGNTVARFTTNGIKADTYANGVTVRGNTLVGPAGGSARAGVEYGFNVAGFTEGDNTFIDLGGSVNTLRGPSTASLLTDATTFPSGESEAALALEGTDRAFGTDGGSTGIIRNLAAFDTGVRARGVHTHEGKIVAKQMTSVTNSYLLEAQTSGASPVWGVTEDGLVNKKQAAPTAKTTSTLLTAAELITGFITVNQGAAGASALQLPTGTNIQSALPSTFPVNGSFDVVISNISTVAAESASITTNTSLTLVGGMDFPAYSAAGTQSSGILRICKTATNVFSVYRIA